MRAEMSELGSDVNDVKKKGDKVQWPTINSNATANDQHSRQVNRTPESNAAIGPTSGATSGATGGATIGATIGETSGATVGCDNRSDERCNERCDKRCNERCDDR